MLNFQKTGFIQTAQFSTAAKFYPLNMLKYPY